MDKSSIIHRIKSGIAKYRNYSNDKAVERQAEAKRNEANISAMRKLHRINDQQIQLKEQKSQEDKEKLGYERQKMLTVISNYIAIEQLRAVEKEHLQEMEERQLRHEILLDTLSDDFNTLEHELSDHLMHIPDSDFLRLVLASESALEARYYKPLLMERDNFSSKLCKGVPHYISRTVASMSPKEIGLLKMLSYLNSLGIINDRYYEKVQLSITYNGGTCSFYGGRYNRDRTFGNEVLRQFAMFWAKSEVEKPAIVLDEAIATIGQVRKTIKNPELQATIEKEILGAKGWLRTASL